MTSFKLFVEQQNVGSLIGASGGGEGGNWGGSLPKLTSLLPMGNWQATSLKRPRSSTRSGFMSDHYQGNSIAYAADFGLNTTFKGNAGAATNFAIQVARNAGANVSSWAPYVGKSFKYNTSDGYRVQVIWQSNVGGNHYDHVHVGVKKGAGAFNNTEDQYQDTDVQAGSLAGGEGGGGESQETAGSPEELFSAVQQGVSNIFNYGKQA